MVDYRRQLTIFIYRKTKDWEAAEDVVQTAFMTSFRKIHTFKGDSALQTWVTTIAINTWLMKLRKEKHYQLANEDSTFISFAPEPNPEDALIIRSENERMLKIINSLPSCYRQSLLMRVKGLEYKQIAKIMGTAIGSVKSYVNRGKKLLRNKNEVHQPQ